MKNRILAIVNVYNLTSSQFAEELDVPKSVLSHIFSGRNNPSLDFITKILQRYPEINPDWLILGKGVMQRDFNANKQSSENQVNNELKNTSQVDKNRLIIEPKLFDYEIEEKPQIIENINEDNKNIFLENKPLIQAQNNEKSEVKDQKIEKQVEINFDEKIEEKVSISEEKITEESKFKDKKNDNKIAISSNKEIVKIILLYNDGTFEDFCQK